ncbi:MAG: YihY/virulence factor BrkB family protein [Lapillicoccus sp.]
MKRLWARIQRLKPYRANQRYNEVRGNLLSAGIAYYAFFSVFPAFAIAAVVFGFVLRGNPELLAQVGDALNNALPGFVKTANNPTGLITLEAPNLSLLTISGLLAVVTLLLSALGWIGSYRDGIRSALGAEGSPGNFLTARLRDLGVFALQGVAFLISAGLTGVLGAASGWIAERVGLGDNTLLVQVVGYLVGYAIDVSILILLLRLLSGVHLPWSALRQSTLVGGLLLTVVKLFGAQLIANATKSPLLGSVVVVIGLLFWLNLIARIVLLSACWAYLDLPDEVPEVAEGRPAQHATVRLIPPSTASAGVADPTVSRPRDRMAIAAGLLLGSAVGAAIAGVVRRRFPD